MTSLIRELARAKVNLTLEVAGRRADGFHEIASLVAFADVGDAVMLDPGGAVAVEMSGPFAGSLTGPNILDRTLSLLRERAPHLRLGAVLLEKNLPVAAGVGGGSADAAALLRAVRQLNGDSARSVDWHGLAALIGADVPACLASQPLWMTGVGHDIAALDGGLPPLDAVLINPLAQMPADKTARVFRALGAPGLTDAYVAPPAPDCGRRQSLLDVMRARGNDLAPAAQSAFPYIGALLDALRACPGIEYAALSGAGPTCFGVFADRAAAEASARAISAREPGWWVASTRLN